MVKFKEHLPTDMKHLAHNAWTGGFITRNRTMHGNKLT
jgi:hypothetical protein